MTTFVWTGRTAAGAASQGEISARNAEEVVTLLRKDRITATSVKKKTAPAKSFMRRGAKVKDKDRMIFTRQLATMVEAGLPLIECLRIIASQAENEALAKTVMAVRTDVEGGSTLADAFRKHPKVFDDFYSNMIAAAEAGGVMEAILNRLARYIEKSMGLARKIKMAMVYPIIVVFVALGVIAIMLIWVIPVFAKLFADFGAGLPALTQMVINFSYFIRHNSFWFAIAFLGAGYGMAYYYRTESGRKQVDHWALKAPVIGDLIRKVAVAKFTRTLGTLISSGIAIMDGMEITAKTAGNKDVEHAILRVRQGVSQGKTLAEPLETEKVFPKMVVSMIAVGESTGSLDTMLNKIADFYDEEVDAAVAGLTAMLEPMLIVFLGVVVGTIVVAMYLPIFKLATVIT